MSIISLGELHHRIRLEEPVRSAEAGGGAAISWSLVAEIWGALRPQASSESAEADGLRARASHEIWIRHRTGLRHDMRFVLGDRVFDIRAIVDTPGRKRFIRCRVEERLP